METTKRRGSYSTCKLKGAPTCHQGEDGDAKGAGGEHDLQPDEAVAAAVQLYVDILLCVLYKLACRLVPAPHLIVIALAH